MTDWASAEDVASAADDWSDGIVHCRTYGHSWRPRTIHHRPGVYTVVQRCPRCTTSRTQEIDESGYPLSSWRPQYPPGYLLHGVGRLGTHGRAVLRIVNLRTATIIEEPQ
jgi:hypothetical protein